MQLIDLVNSKDPKENIRSQLLTLRELDWWVNKNLLLQVNGVVHKSRRRYIDLKFRDDFFSRYMETGSVMTGIVEYDDTHDIDYSNVFAILGNTFEIQEHFGMRCDAWLLAADDWPLVTVELITRGFETQKKYNTRVQPDFMTTAVNRWFPSADYLKLLDLYKTDMLSLEPNEEGIPLLRDVLYDLAIQPSSGGVYLPGDLTI